jgi:hypothetical protein
LDVLQVQGHRVRALLSELRKSRLHMLEFYRTTILYTL